ncbi:hypothetical protein JCM11641_002614 [Rhodosporidiobolus odoratus]
MPSLLDLPDELIVSIIQLVVVPSALASFEEYLDRWTSLWRLALTSKRLDRVASQDLNVVLRLLKDDAQLRETFTPKQGADAKVLVLEATEAWNPNDTKQQPLTGLEVLQVIRTTPAVFDLRLVTDAEELLSPRTLPALRHLSICHLVCVPNEGENGAREFEFEQATPPSLAALDPSMLAGNSPFRSPHEFAQFPYVALLASPAQHHSPHDLTRLDKAGYSALALNNLPRLSDAILSTYKANGLSLKLILLDKAFAGLNLRAAKAPLLKICEEVGIEVMELEKPRYNHESLVSQQFIHWSKR